MSIASSQQATRLQMYAPRPGTLRAGSTTTSPSGVRTSLANSALGPFVRQATQVRNGTCLGLSPWPRGPADTAATGPRSATRRLLREEAACRERHAGQLLVAP